MESDSGVINKRDMHFGGAGVLTNHDALTANCLASRKEMYELKQQEVSKGRVCKFFTLNQYGSLSVIIKLYQFLTFSLKLPL